MMSRVVLLALCLLMVWTLPVAAKTWYVEKDGSGDYAVIQDAVNACADGDSVRIGAGRFSEYLQYNYPGGVWNVYVNATVGALTIIGAGTDLTFIGPENPGTWGFGDYCAGIMSGSFIPGGVPDIPDGELRVENLTVNDVSSGGIYATTGGTIAVDNCNFLRGFCGVKSFVTGRLEGCEFVECGYQSVLVYNPAWGFEIDDCNFVECWAGFNFKLVGEIFIQNSTFDDCGSLGMFDQCSGGMINCNASVLQGGLVVYGPGGGAGYTITDNIINGGLYNINFGYGADNVECERNVLTESTISAINIVNSLPRIRNNHIIRGEGYTVELDGWLGPIFETLQYLDMSNNYWGTTDVDSISAWIWDAHDTEDPELFGVVEFEPFSAVPLPEEKTSLGDLKSMFR